MGESNADTENGEQRPPRKVGHDCAARDLNEDSDEKHGLSPDPEISWSEDAMARRASAYLSDNGPSTNEPKNCPM